MKTFMKKKYFKNDLSGCPTGHARSDMFYSEVVSFSNESITVQISRYEQRPKQ